MALKLKNLTRLPAKNFILIIIRFPFRELVGQLFVVADDGAACFENVNAKDSSGKLSAYLACGLRDPVLQHHLCG